MRVTSFGEWVKQRRQDLRLTQIELADLVGCSLATIRKIEADIRRPSRQMAELMAERLKLPQEDWPAFVRFARASLTEEADDWRSATGGTQAIDAEATSPSAPPTNLVKPITEVIGREAELAALHDYLAGERVRLLTLTGAPGIGKTRLAIEAGMRATGSFPDGVFFVQLAPVQDPGMVVPAIAQVLGLREASNRPIEESLRQFLHTRRMLLLLDNFEQVVVAADTVTEMLRSAPGLKVLVTSRAALNVQGEQQLPLAPLGLPEPDQLPGVDDLLLYPSVALFVERAQSVSPDFRLTPENAAPVAAICARVDGLPLAIELVAVRVRVLPPSALLARLSNRLGLLRGGHQDLPARQQTLRGALAWSYDLLSEGEQCLFARLGVFVGGCTLGAIEAVSNSTGDLPFYTLEGVQSLVDKSLLRAELDDAAEARFSMLETIREYAVERLHESGEDESLRRLHAEYYLALAESAEQQMAGAEQKWWLDLLEREHDNLRAALDWSLSADGDTAVGLSLAANLHHLWWVRGYFSEGRNWMLKVLARAGDTGPAVARARVMWAAGHLTRVLGNTEEGRTLNEQSLALFRAIGDQEGTGRVLSGLGAIARDQNDDETAKTLYEEALALRRSIGDKYGMTMTLANLQDLAWRRGDFLASVQLNEETLALCYELSSKRGIAGNTATQGYIRGMLGSYEEGLSLVRSGITGLLELGDQAGTATGHIYSGVLKWRMGNLQGAEADLRYSLEVLEQMKVPELANWARYNLGVVALFRGDHEEARELLQAARSEGRRLNNHWYIAWTNCQLAQIALLERDYAQAASLLGESLALFLELGDKAGLVTALETTARIASIMGQAKVGVEMLGAASTLREQIGVPVSEPEKPTYDELVSSTRQALGDSRYESAWSAGRVEPLGVVTRKALELCRVWAGVGPTAGVR